MMYSLLFVAFITMTFFCAHLQSNELDKETLEWCSAIKGSPEPDLLYYNRIPKCASSTMLDLFRAVAREHGRVIAYDLDKSLWSDRPSLLLQQELYKDVNERIFKPSTKLVFNSHTGYFPYNTSSIKYHKTIEQTQVLRECESRQISHFFYDIYGVLPAKRAALAHNSSRFMQKKLELSSDTEVAPCLRSERCLANVIRPDIKSNWIATYMGGCSSSSNIGQCRDTSHQAAALVSENIKPTGVYKTFGMSEHLYEYLEMLECVYPTMLRGIVKIYGKRKKLRINKQNTSGYNVETMSIVSKLAVDKCAKSSDDYIYHNLINNSFWRRHAAVKIAPYLCCRKRKDIR